MYIHNIDPVIFSIGPLSARWYGLVYVLTFLFSYYFVKRHIKEFGVTREQFDAFALECILGIILGARLFAVFVWNPAYYFANPLKIFAVWEGGMALHGGLIGIALVGWRFCKKYNVDPARMADLIAIPAMVGLMFGRIANFINGEIVGTVTNVPWCVVFPQYDQLCRHPVQLYAAIGRAFLVAYLFILYKTKFVKKGFIFWSAMFLMGVGRFVIDFLREDPRWFGLSMGQYLSIVLAVVSAIVLYVYYYKEKFKRYKEKK